MNEWINDATLHCDSCDTTFKVYVLNNEPTTNFCPICGSRKLKDVENIE